MVLSPLSFSQLEVLHDDRLPLPYTLRWTNGINSGRGFKPCIDTIQKFSGTIVPSGLQNQEELLGNPEKKY